MINIVPNKEHVDYNKIYSYNSKELIEQNFTFWKENRKINKAHLNKMFKFIMNDKFNGKFFPPILVDINTLIIVDGQHRKSAFLNALKNGKDVNLRVIYVDIPEEDLKDVILSINNGSRDWQLLDFIENISNKDSMALINQFGENHTLTRKTNRKGEIIGHCNRYTWAILFGKNITKEVRNNNISITKKQLEKGEILYNEIEKLYNALYPNVKISTWFESFCQAWYNIRNTDNLTNNFVEKYGIDFICEDIKNYFENWQISTNRRDWDYRFHGAICNIERNLQ